MKSGYTVTEATSEMDARSRTTLTLVDVMGVDSREAFNLVGIAEEGVTQILAKVSRQQLVNFKFRRE